MILKSAALGFTQEIEYPSFSMIKGTKLEA
jgi:hypothetical protein